MKIVPRTKRKIPDIFENLDKDAHMQKMYLENVTVGRIVCIKLDMSQMICVKNGAI